METQSLRPIPRQGVMRIKAHMAGPSDASVEPRILLNSNESAYGPSPKAEEAMRKAIGEVARYLEFPDRIMSPAIGSAQGLAPERIVTGFGSDDLLARVARIYMAPGDNLIRSANGYLKVPNYAYANDGEVISVPDRSFVPDVDAMIAAVNERTRIVYLANPENPAGTYLSGSEVRRLHAALPPHVLLVLDCAYEEYVDAPDYEPGRALAGEADNVLVTHTFSKIYGLAGARVGWAYGPEHIIDPLRRIGVTFPLTTPSAAGVLAALEDQAHVELVRRENAREKAHLAEELSRLGFDVVPSQTNFLLIHVPERAEALETHLAQQGILIRRFASPAYADYVRITLGLPEENAECLVAIKQWAKGES